MSIESGARPGKYRVVSRFEAEDTVFNRRVALKVLPPGFAHDAVRAQRFQQEVMHAAARERPEIVTVYDLGSEAGPHYNGMTLLSGGDRRGRIRDRRLSPQQPLCLARPIARATSSGSCMTGIGISKARSSGHEASADPSDEGSQSVKSEPKS